MTKGYALFQQLNLQVKLGSCTLNVEGVVKSLACYQEATSAAGCLRFPDYCHEIITSTNALYNLLKT